MPVDDTSFMDNIDCTQRRPSLYTAITLAKLLCNFRDRLRMRIQSKKSRAIKSSKLELNTFQSKAHAQTQMFANHSDNLEKPAGHEQLPRAISQIDNQDPSWIVSLCNVARDDRKLLTFDSQQYGRFWRQKQASRILDNTTLLLQYLTNLQNDPAARHEASMEHNIYDLAEFDKYLANLEHLTRCLQQVALNTLVQNTLDLLASSVSYWYKRLDCAHSRSDDWYSEWSSGRPPLNSTMPWNIKASLVVLWGVCWMFYPPYSPGSSEKTWRSQNPDPGWESETAVSTNAQAIGTAAALSSPVEVLIQHTADAMPYPSHSDLRSPLTQYGNISDDQPLMIGRYSRGSYRSDSVPMSQTGPGLGHMAEAGYNDAQLSRQAASGLELQNYGPAFSSAGIKSPLTASATVSPPQGSSDIVAPFYHNQPSAWSTPLPGQTISHYGPSSQPGPYANTLSTLSYPPSTPVNSYPQNLANTPSFSRYWENQSLQPEHQMANSINQYPMSPSSVPSERESSIAPAPITSYPVKHSSSTDTSPIRSGREASQEPPQDEHGNYYCNDPRCANRPTRFARKCEWKKHRDTHTRPYICRVPGCEKIQGFTYSGGLLRHEREVHQQHGGPIKRYFCPHADCKRSEGQSFSRKENLTEHLRRVHRNKEFSLIKSEPALSPRSPIHERPFGSDLPGKKRKYTSDESSPRLTTPQLEGIIQGLRNEVNKLNQQNSELLQQNAELHRQLQARDTHTNALFNYTPSR